MPTGVVAAHLGLLGAATSTGMVAALLAGVLADRFGRTPVIFAMASASAACSLVFGWLLAAPLALVVGVGLLCGFSALVPPAYRGSALALRSLLGYGAGAIAPLAFGAILDWYGTGTAGAWGWAFVSLGIAGGGAVMSVALLHATPGAAALRRGAGRRPVTAPASVR